jgi:DNA-binding transcriptional LysR family regulator
MLKNGTIKPTRVPTKIDDMRLFAKVAELKSFTTAARALGLPKQTLSRRIGQLEASLEIRLMHRTTRKLVLTDLGAAYAERCSEIVRNAEEANRIVTDAHDVPRGTLRVTADPVFGEAFLTGLIIAYARKWPEVQLEVALTRRRVDLIEEGFDVAFRVGQVDDPSLSGIPLGPARVRYCGSPKYFAQRGTPKTPDELANHDCLVVGSSAVPMRWPFRGPKGMKLVPISGRMSFTSFPMARAAALAGAGIAIFPEFACVDDVRRGKLVPVLDHALVDVGSIWLVHATRKFLSARVRAFVAMARDRFLRSPPWVVEGRKRKRGG